MLRRARAADSQLEIMSFLCWRWPRHLRQRRGELTDRKRFRNSVDRALNRNRGCFPAANTECGDTALKILRFKRVQQRDDEASSGGADGMAERASPAIDVQFLAGNSKVSLGGHGDHRERLVDLEQIDLTNAPADLVEQLADRRDRRGRKPLRFLAVGRVSPDRGEDRQSLALGGRSPRENKCGGAIGIGGGSRGRDRAIGTKGGF